VGAKESKTYYHTIAELSTPKGAEARHRMRVGGTVRAGSIARYTGRVDFVIEGEGKSLPVSYTGSDPLPDTFVDNSQALVEGRLAPNGAFVADKVQAKCASKYEAAPDQQKKEHETPRIRSEMQDQPDPFPPFVKKMIAKPEKAAQAETETLVI